MYVGVFGRVEAGDRQQSRPVCPTAVTVWDGGEKERVSGEKTRTRGVCRWHVCFGGTGKDRALAPCSTRLISGGTVAALSQEGCPRLRHVEPSVDIPVFFTLILKELKEKFNVSNIEIVLVLFFAYRYRIELDSRSISTTIYVSYLVPGIPLKSGTQEVSRQNESYSYACAEAAPSRGLAIVITRRILPYAKWNYQKRCIKKYSIDRY